MTRVTGPDCAVMCSVINTHTHIRTHTHKRIKSKQERVGSVAANPDHVENNKEAGGGEQCTHGLSQNCTS